MCGVVARIGSNEVAEPLRRLSHRGIRDRVMENRWGAIGHTRLPIVGVGPENDQPRRAWPWMIAFVGEVLDFRDSNPSAKCDFDAVESAWHILGPSGLKTRDGFWSVVAIDERNGDLHVLCDYLAQKPMYFRVDFPCVASELDAVRCVGPVTIDEVYMSSVIKWGYCPDTRRTPYREVRHVLPGEHVVIHQDGRVFREIVDRLEPLPMTDGELRSEIVAAVERRVMSADVPVAALLSGGLDSSIVYSIAREFGTVRPYYIQNGAIISEEIDAVEAVTRGADLRIVDSSSINTGVRSATRIMQEPIDLGSLVPQIVLSESVDEDVCLTGDGADEFFGGYSRARRYDSQPSDVWQELVAWHLPRLDRIMMRHCIEVRSPFLARRVAAAALALPWDRRNNGKKILKDMFADILPHEVLDLPKIPLKTRVIENGREDNSRAMVEVFLNDHKNRTE